MNLFAQGHAIDELHHDEVGSFVFTNLMDLGDVRMIERGGRLRLTNEPLHTIAIRSNIRRQNFQRDSAIELGVLRQIHLTHPAHADLRADFIAT